MTTDEPNQGATGQAPHTATADAGRAGAGRTGTGPPISQGASEFVDEHPEALVGAAFVGGFVVAQILKQLSE